MTYHHLYFPRFKMMLPKRFIKRAVITLAVTVVLLVFLFVYLERIIPQFLNLGEIKTKIEQSILDSTGIRAEIKKLSINLTMLNGVEVRFDNNVLYDPKGIEVVDSGQIIVNIRYLPLLQHKTSISRVAFNNIAVTVGEKGFLYNIKQKEAPSEEVVLENTRIEFNNYRILVDQFFDGKNKYLLHGDSLALAHFHAKQPLELTGLGTLFFGYEKPNQKLGRFEMAIEADQRLAGSKQLDWRDVYRFNMQLREVELPTLANIAQAYGFPLKASGEVGTLGFEYNGREPRKFTIQGNTPTETKVSIHPYYFEFDPGRVLLTTELAPNPDKKEIKLSHFHLDLTNPDFEGHIRANLMIKTPFEKSFGNINVRTSPLEISGLGILPVLTPAQHKILDSLGGKFSTDLQLSGLLANPNIKGTLGLDDLFIQYRDTKKRLADNVKVRVQLVSSRQFYLKGLEGKIAGSPVAADGFVDLDNKRIQGKINAPNIDLGKLQSIIRIFIPENPFLAHYAFSGQAGVQLNANGTFSDPNAAGRVSFNRFRIADAGRKITLMEKGFGVIDFRSGLVSIPDIHAMFGGGLLQLSGWIKQNQSDSDLKLEAPRLDAGKLQAVVQGLASAMGQPVSAFKDISLSGYLASRMHVTGPLSNPKPQGYIALKGIDVKYHPKKVILQNLAGVIQLHPNAIIFPGIRGHFRNIPFTLAGTAHPSFKRYHIRMNTPEIAVTRLQQMIADFAPGSLAQFKRAGLQSGTVRFALAFSQVYPGGLGGMIHIKNILAKPPELGVPVKIATMVYDVAHSRLVIPKSIIYIDRFQLETWGYVANNNYNIHIVSNRMPVSLIREERPFLERVLKGVPLPTLYNTEGELNLVANVKNDVTRATVEFLNAGASMQELKYPVYNINGRLALTSGKQFRLEADNLNFKYANSPAAITLTMAGPKNIKAKAEGVLSPLLINDLFPLPNAWVAPTLPFQLDLAGAIGSFNGYGKGNNLTANLNLNLKNLFSTDTASISSIQIAPFSIAENPVLTAALHLKDDILDIEPARLLLGENNGAQLVGRIQHVFMPEVMETAFDFETQPVLDLTRASETFSLRDENRMGGEVQGAVQWASAPLYSDLEGKITFNRLMIAFLNLENLDGSIALKDKSADIKIANITLPGLDTGLSTTIPDIYQNPMDLTAFELNGRQLVLDKVIDWMDRIITKRVNPMVAQFVPAAPDAQAQGNLPFKIQNGSIRLTDVLFNNVAMHNFTSRLALNPDQSFMLENLHTKIAKGDIKGTFAMAPRKNNRVATRLNLEKVQVETLFKMFTDEPSQIFGNVSGDVELATEGKTPEEMLANASGNGKLKIDKGRLPQVARLENLLLATTTLAGGVLSGNLFNINNLNWNNLFNLATRYRTDYFATLTGSFTMQKGVIHTEDLLVDGQNLDFNVKGDFNLTNEIANMTVRGQMDRDVGGGLGIISNTLFGRFFTIAGPLRAILGFANLEKRLHLQRTTVFLSRVAGAYQLGRIVTGGVKLSGFAAVAHISTAVSALGLLEYIPPIRRIIDRIPGIGYVPGVGIPLSDNGIAFEAQVIGPVSDGSSIKNFHWVRPKAVGLPWPFGRTE